jgi:hypothetical protein
MVSNNSSCQTFWSSKMEKLAAWRGLLTCRVSTFDGAVNIRHGVQEQHRILPPFIAPALTISKIL